MKNIKFTEQLKPAEFFLSAFQPFSKKQTSERKLNFGQNTRCNNYFIHQLACVLLQYHYVSAYIIYKYAGLKKHILTWIRTQSKHFNNQMTSDFIQLLWIIMHLQINQKQYPVDLFNLLYPLILLLCYMLVSCSVSNQLQKSTFIIVMMQTVVLQNKRPSQMRAINDNIHKSLSNSYKNPETLGKFSSVQNKSCLWGASLCATTQFALTWFHFSQELSPLARLSLPWQNPQRLDFPFIWLWFTRPFWPHAPFTTNT